MIALKIAGIALLLYVVFFAAPPVVSYFAAFSRKTATPLEEMRRPKDYYLPYLDRLRADGAWVSALTPEEITISAPDGIPLAADLYRRGQGKTAICLHGYGAEPLSNFRCQGRLLYTQGFDLLLVHQRAHGRSGGKWTALGLLEQYDLLAWVRWAQSDGAKDILLYGMSMGCAAVSYAADQLSGTPVRAMVLDCGFTSPYDQLFWDCRKRHLPARVMLPVIALCARLHQGVDLRTPVTDSLRHTSVPALFFHGEADRTVPVSQGLRNYEACSSPKEKLIVPGAGHTVSFLASPAAEETLLAFLRRYFA